VVQGLDLEFKPQYHKKKKKKKRKEISVSLKDLKLFFIIFLILLNSNAVFLLEVLALF
jgi:hypothetical protein